MKTKLLVLAAAALAVTLRASDAGKNQPEGNKNAAEIAYRGPQVLWRNPTDISSRNLFYGIGGKQHQPPATGFTFVKEDMDGSNPKFVVEDASGIKWKVKMGAEARPEVAASRLVWAAGYFAEEDYFVANLKVTGMRRLKRGQSHVGPDGTVHNVRLKRQKKAEEKLGNWTWRNDPFTGTQEWYGLRVLMALMNNWDLKDVNNTIFESPGSQVRTYMTTDLGASFGTTGIVLGHGASRGNLNAYRHSHFIRKVSSEYVDFSTPSSPSPIFLFHPPTFIKRLHLRWIGRQIPRKDAQWIGHLLANLSRQQISDAFRAAGYDPQQVEGFTSVVEARIAELDKL